MIEPPEIPDLLGLLRRSVGVKESSCNLQDSDHITDADVIAGAAISFQTLAMISAPGLVHQPAGSRVSRQRALARAALRLGNAIERRRART